MGVSAIESPFSGSGCTKCSLSKVVCFVASSTTLLNNVFAWFIVPVIAVGRVQFITPMYWTLQNLEGSEHKQYMVH
jgi:hypothetical protein